MRAPQKRGKLDKERHPTTVIKFKNIRTYRTSAKI